MRRKIGFALGGTATVWLLSACFVLQGFILLDYTLTPGQVTKARFTLRPSNFENGIGPPYSGAQYEFVVVGVSDTGDLTATTAKWGTNGTFGGPLNMAVNGSLLTAILTAGCGNHGLDIADMTALTFKAYVTPNKIGDGNKYEQKVNVDVNIKAQADAAPGDEWHVVGVAGQWWDDGDDTPESGSDIFSCHGIGSAVAHIRAA